MSSHKCLVCDTYFTPIRAFSVSLTLPEIFSLHYFISFHALSPQACQTLVANLLQHAAIFPGPVCLSQISSDTVTFFFSSITVMLGTFRYVIVFVQIRDVELIQSYVSLFHTTCSSRVEDDVLLRFVTLVVLSVC